MHEKRLQSSIFWWLCPLYTKRHFDFANKCLHQYVKVMFARSAYGRFYINILYDVTFVWRVKCRVSCWRSSTCTTDNDESSATGITENTPRPNPSPATPTFIQARYTPVKFCLTPCLECEQIIVYKSRWLGNCNIWFSYFHDSFVSTGNACAINHHT